VGRQPMAAAELAARPPASAHQRTRLPWPRAIADTLAALVIVTVVGAGAGAIDHSLFGSAAPHPTLHPTATAIASILATNARVLALPFVLIVFGSHTTRAGRTAGDALLLAVLGANALRVGVAIGRWQTRLLPYLPHLPLEYAAVAVATSAWLRARQQATGDPPTASNRQTARPPLLPAAGCCSPPPPSRSCSLPMPADQPPTGPGAFAVPGRALAPATRTRSIRSSPAADVGRFAFGRIVRQRTAHSLQGRSLPLAPRGSVPLGRHIGATRPSFNHPIPTTGGTNEQHVRYLEFPPDSARRRVRRPRAQKRTG
jgi:hypothetical protein